MGRTLKEIFFRFSRSQGLRPAWNIFYKTVNPLTKSSLISNHPGIYLFYARHFKPDTFWVAPHPKTDLLVEGAGGCGTHALVSYIKKHNPDIDVAHTCEVPATIKYAVKQGIPVIVPTRNMLEYIRSVVTRFPQISQGNAMKVYTHFHKQVYPLSTHIIIADFQEIIREPRNIIERCNEKFGTAFNTGDNILPRVRTTMETRVENIEEAHQVK
jgi:hypothetical protein